jgi:hypothetical protein
MRQQARLLPARQLQRRSRVDDGASGRQRAWEEGDRRRADYRLVGGGGRCRYGSRGPERSQLFSTSPTSRSSSGGWSPLRTLLPAEVIVMSLS